MEQTGKSEARASLFFNKIKVISLLTVTLKWCTIMLEKRYLQTGIRIGIQPGGYRKN